MKRTRKTDSNTAKVVYVSPPAVRKKSCCFSCLPPFGQSGGNASITRACPSLWEVEHVLSLMSCPAFSCAKCLFGSVPRAFGLILSFSH